MGTNMNKIGDYIYICEDCGKKFNLVNGEGIGFSYMGGGMLPKTKYVCMKCFRKNGYSI